MDFRVTPKRSRTTRRADHPTFKIDRLWQSTPSGKEAEISHLVDRSYAYHSLKELRWHLAARFDLPVASIALNAA